MLVQDFVSYELFKSLSPVPLWVKFYFFSVPVNLLFMEFTPIRSQQSVQEPYVLNRRVTIVMFVWASIYMVGAPTV